MNQCFNNIKYILVIQCLTKQQVKQMRMLTAEEKDIFNRLVRYGLKAMDIYQVYLFVDCCVKIYI